MKYGCLDLGINMETINCKQCGNEALKYKNYQYNKPQTFCNFICYTEYKKTILKEKSHRWKGMNANYSSKHMWIHNNIGSANKCENINCLKTSRTYQWANISGKYLREFSDYKQLCVSCHKKMDLRKNNKCKNGHKRTPNNTYIRKDGVMNCRICNRNREIWRFSNGK